MHIVKEDNNYNENINRIAAISAGGSGGHIFPALTVAKMLIQEGFYVIFYTDKKFFKYVKQEDIFLQSGMIEIIQLTVKNAPRWKQVFMIIRDFFSCIQILTKKVSICIGFGGLVSFTPMIFGILTLKKTIIHEQNAVIGLANKILLPFVSRCLLSFKDTAGIAKVFRKKCIFVGNPIRDEIKKMVYNYDNPSVNYQAFYKIEDIINLTITGGSQACEAFDKIIPQAIALLPVSIANRLHVIHQCKENNIEVLRNFYTEYGISHNVGSFFYNIGEILRMSHLVISRAGSTTISEISALGVPSILIPLPTSANNHQFYNAKFLRDNNATILLEQKNLTKETLSQFLLNLFNHDKLLSELSRCCRMISNINADALFLNEINAVLGIENKYNNTDDAIWTKNACYINDNVGLG